MQIDSTSTANPMVDAGRGQEIMRMAFRPTPARLLPPEERRAYALAYPDRNPSAARGTGNSQAKMTERKVYAIRRAADAGASLQHLAEAFAISVRACRHIARRTSWAHLPEEN
ncbi:hypothetical protein [Kitasatospora sp. McL0602]|uniref:hypothetical protein n=1 Tax=Kitasatospora sp. McL0602 TaxID=3439530 RepID=UPI003F897458